MDNARKKIMFITLGTGTGVGHGILFSIKMQNPNVVVFIVTNESIKTFDELLVQLKESQLDDFVADLAGEVVITISTPDREFSINFNQINGLSQYQVEY